MIGAGSYRDRVRVISRTATRNHDGETFSESVVKTLWCCMSVLSASEALKYQSLDIKVTHKALFRGAPGIQYSRHELQWGELRLHPVKPVITPGGSNGNITVVVCADITTDRAGLGSGSGS